MEKANALEIINFAISIEEQGIKFYNEYSKLAKGEIKDLLLKLASDEESHADEFRKMLDKVSADNYYFSEEVDEYFRSYANHIAFNRRNQKLTSIKEVLEVAIETEKITTEFYQGLIPKTSDEKVVGILKTLVEEETKHRVVLEDYLKKTDEPN